MRKCCLLCTLAALVLAPSPAGAPLPPFTLQELATWALPWQGATNPWQVGETKVEKRWPDAS